MAYRPEDRYKEFIPLDGLLGRADRSPPAPRSPRLTLTQGGQWLPDPLEELRRKKKQSRANIEQAYRTDTHEGRNLAGREFLDSIRKPEQTYLPINPLQNALISLGGTISDSPVADFMLPGAGNMISNVATGTATPGQIIGGTFGLGLGAFDAATLGTTAPARTAARAAYQGVKKGVYDAIPRGKTYYGTHFSEEARPYLMTDYAGSNRNLTGAERGREGARDSVQAYRHGVRPETGTGTAGHEVKMTRILDSGSAPANKLRDEARAKIQARLDKEAAGRWNPGRPQPAEVTSMVEQMAFERGWNGIRHGDVIKSFKDLKVRGRSEVELPNPTPKSLANYAKQHPDGFTIDPVTGAVPKSGIVGARRGTEDIVTEVTPESLAKRLEETPTRPGEYLGGWAEGGKLFLDNSKVMARSAFPRLRGNANYQLSLWDIDKAREIPLGLRRMVEDPSPVAGGWKAQMGAINPGKPPHVNLHGRDIPVKMPKRAENTGERLVHLKTDKMEEGFQGSMMYVGKGGQPEAGGIKNRYERFGQFAKDTDNIETPEISITPTGGVSFTNGRHRYSYMRDQGVKDIPVAMDEASIKNAEKLGMLSDEIADAPIDFNQFKQARADKELKAQVDALTPEARALYERTKNMSDAEKRKEATQTIMNAVMKELTPLDIAAKYKARNINPAHKVGDRFKTDEGYVGGKKVPAPELEIIEMDYPTGSGVAAYTVRQKWADGDTSTVRLSDENLDYMEKYGVAGEAPEAPRVTDHVTGAREVVPAQLSGSTHVGAMPRDPRYDARVKEQGRLDDLVTRTEGSQHEPPEVSIFDLEGKPFITGQADRSASGDVLTGINDVDLQRPVTRFGGQGYPFHNPPGTDPQVWAAGGQHPETMLELAKDVRNATGQNPLFMPWAMTPTSLDFAHMTGETMLSYAASNMGKAAQRSLNKQMKEIIPGWKGVADPKSVTQYRNATAKQRRDALQMLDRDYRNEGGMGIGEARLAVSDPDQLAIPRTGLMNVGEIDATRSLMGYSGHPTYPMGIPGHGVGRLKENLSVGDLLPQLYNARGFNQFARSLEMKPYAGIISEDILKKLAR